MTYLLIISSILMVFIDLVYLSMIGKSSFEKTVSAIQGSKLVVSVPPAIFTYILMVIVLNYFIISASKPAFDAFILGFCVYGIFDFTNLAIFKNYTLKTAIMDTLWGAILFYVTTLITYKIKKMF